MNMLENGVKLIVTTLNEIDGQRLWLSAGTMEASDLRKEKEVNYAPGARVPKLPWRPPSPVEYDTLVDDDLHTSPGRWINILSVPDRIMEPFRPLKEAAEQAKSLMILQDIINSESCQQGIQQTKAHFATLNEHSKQEMEGAFIFGSKGDRLTLTYDHGPEFIGLHLDSWYRGQLEKRDIAPNRICLNLGPSDRYLLYINIPLQEMFARLEEVGSDDPERNYIGSPLGRAFMRQFPEYPVVKLRVQPGEAYIAPTENISHDGSSEGNLCLDVQLTIRGQFNPMLSAS